MQIINLDNWYYPYYLAPMRTRKIQSKIEPELEIEVKKQPDFKGMSDYVRSLLIKKTKFRTKEKI